MAARCFRARSSSRAAWRARGSRRRRSQWWATAAGRRAGSWSGSPMGGRSPSGCPAAGSTWTRTAASGRPRAWPRCPAGRWRRSASATACASRWSTSWRFVRAVGGGLDVDGDGAPDTGQGPLFLRGTLARRDLRHDLPRRRVAGAGRRPDGPGRARARDRAPLARVSAAGSARRSRRRSPPLLGRARRLTREDLPLRGDGPVVAPAPGAAARSRSTSRGSSGWAATPSPVAYARHLRRSPLPGLEPARVLVQFALGDRVVPNTTTAALVRAGELGDRTVLVRSRQGRPRGRGRLARPARVPPRRPRPGPRRPRRLGGAGAAGPLPARRGRGRLDPERGSSPAGSDDRLLEGPSGVPGATGR